MALRLSSHSLGSGFDAKDEHGHPVAAVARVAVAAVHCLERQLAKHGLGLQAQSALDQKTSAPTLDRWNEALLVPCA